MQKSWETPAMETLFRAVLTLKNEEEVGQFFRDIATITELQEMAKRFLAAQMLSKGIPYREISEQTGLSTTTVSRVAYWMQNGEGGYSIALSRLFPEKETP